MATVTAISAGPVGGLPNLGEGGDVDQQHLVVLANNHRTVGRLKCALAQVGQRLGRPELGAQRFEVGSGLGRAGQLLDREGHGPAGVDIAARVEMVYPGGFADGRLLAERQAKIMGCIGDTDHFGDGRGESPGRQGLGRGCGLGCRRAHGGQGHDRNQGGPGAAGPEQPCRSGHARPPSDGLCSHAALEFGPGGRTPQAWPRVGCAGRVRCLQPAVGARP